MFSQYSSNQYETRTSSSSAVYVYESPKYAMVYTMYFRYIVVHVLEVATYRTDFFLYISVSWYK